MKIFLTLSIILAIALTSDAFLQKFLESVTNIASNLKDAATNVKDSITNAIALGQLSAQILWDNAFKPSLDILVNNGTVFIDKKFGDILNNIGKRELSVEGAHQLREVFKSETKKLLFKFETKFAEFLNYAKEFIKSNLANIVAGTTHIDSSLREKLEVYKEIIRDIVKETIKNVQKPFGPEYDVVIKELKENIEKMGIVFIGKLNALNQILTDKIGGPKF